MGNPISRDPGAGKLQDGATKVVVDRPRGAAMHADPPKAPSVAIAGLAAMAAADAVKPPPAVIAGALVMPAFREAPATDPARPPKIEGEMKPFDQPGDAQRTGYIRLRVRVTNDQMRIVGARRVEGPLVQTSDFVGEHVYEVLLDGKMVAREGLPDIGVSRSYPRPGEMEHHVTERPTVEFNVRLPLDRVPANALSRVRLSLFRLPDGAPRTVTGLVAEQLGQQARLVARIDGLTQARIEPQALEILRTTFAPSFTPPR